MLFQPFLFVSSNSGQSFYPSLYQRITGTPSARYRNCTFDWNNRVSIRLWWVCFPLKILDVKYHYNGSYSASHLCLSMTFFAKNKMMQSLINYYLCIRVLEDVTLHLNGSVPSTKEANVEQMALELMELVCGVLWYRVYLIIL